MSLGTQSHTLTATPVDIKAALSLEEGKVYQAQYLGGRTAYFNSGASAPAASTRAVIVVDSGDTTDLYPISGENIYAWGDGDISVDGPLADSGL